MRFSRHRPRSSPAVINFRLFIRRTWPTHHFAFGVGHRAQSLRRIGEARGALPRWTKTNVTSSQRGIGAELQSGPRKNLDPSNAGLFGLVRLIPLAVQAVE